MLKLLVKNWTLPIWIVITIFFALMTGCSISDERRGLNNLPQIPAHRLLLDDTAFPEQWNVDPCEPYCSKREGINEAYRVFGMLIIPGHVVQEVYRLNTADIARYKFRTYYDTEFHQRQSPNRTFVPPKEIQYTSPIADEYAFGCGIDIVSACVALMRYDNYFVYLYINTDETGNGLKITEVEPILRAMDAMVISRFGLKNPSATQMSAK